MDWKTEDLPSTSSFRYGFDSKNVLRIDHYLGSVLSSQIKIGFSYPLKVDECLACLPRGKEALRRAHNEVTIWAHSCG